MIGCLQVAQRKWDRPHLVPGRDETAKEKKIEKRSEEFF